MVYFFFKFYAMTYKCFQGRSCPKQGKEKKKKENNEVLVYIIFTQTHLKTVLVIKKCISKLPNELFIKRKGRAGKAHANRILLSFKMSLTHKNI